METKKTCFDLFAYALAPLLAVTSGCSSDEGPAGGSPDEPEAPEGLGERLDAYFEELVDDGFSGAVLVAQEGTPILAEGYGLAYDEGEVATTATTVFDVGSLSKQFTAAAVLKLREQGLLSLEDTLPVHFEEVPEDKAGITLHQLLTHTSGLAPYVYVDDFAETTRAEALELALESELESEPGTEYSYSDTGYGLAALVVERASGQEFTEYLREQLFAPAGMERSGFYNDEQWEDETVAHGYFNGEDLGSAATRPGPYWGILGFGGVLTTVGDLHAWTMALDEHTVLDEASTEALFTPYVRENPEGDSYYGYGWVVLEVDGVPVVGHDGATDSHNAILVMMEDEPRTRVIVLSNRIVERGGEEVFFGVEAGVALATAIIEDDLTIVPGYAE